jgi:tetratricopeptide (TPR) repeat protein
MALVGRHIRRLRSQPEQRDQEATRGPWRSTGESPPETLANQIIPLELRNLGPHDMTTLSTRRYLASILEFEGKFSEADRVGREALAASRSGLGPENPETLRTMNVLANILDDEKRIPEAEKLYRETLAIQLRTLGPDAPETLTTDSNLAGALQEQGRLDDAEKLERETLATRFPGPWPGTSGHPCDKV